MAISSRSDVYKNFTDSLSLPSCTLFILLAGSTISTYSYILQNSKISQSGALLTIAGLIFSFKTVKKYIVLKNRSLFMNSFRVFLFYMVLFSCTLLNLLHIRDLTVRHEIIKDKIYTATVTDILQKRYYDEIRVELDGTMTPVHGNLTYNSLRIGDRIELRCAIKEIQHGTDFYVYMSRRGIYYTSDLEDNFIKKEETGKGKREGIRKKISENCDTIFTEKTSGVIKGLYFGSTGFIDSATSSSYRKAGVTHIISASGFNVAVITFIPLILLTAAGIKKRFAMLSLIPLVFFYFYISDMPVSLLRAVIMFSIFSIQILFGFSRNIINSLFLAASAIIIIFPYELYSLGFQLSFCATIGIILFYKQYLKSLSFLPKFLSSALSLTISAQLLTLPIIASTLHELNINGLATNIVAVPFVSLVMNISIAANCIFFLSPSAGAIAGKLTDILYSGCSFFIDFMAGCGGHFLIDGTGIPLALAFSLLAMPLIPSIPLKKFSSAGIFFFVLSVIIIYYRPYKESEAVKISGTYGNAYIVRDGKNCTVFGEISGARKSFAIIREIEKYPLSRASLYISNADSANISSCIRIIKNSRVTSCTLPEYYPFGRHTRFFFDHLQKESIELRIEDYELKKISSVAAAAEIKNYPFADNKIIDSLLKKFDHYTEKIILEK